MIDNKYFTEPVASELEAMRDKARTQRHITFDCYHTRVKNGKVYCAKGHKLSLTLLKVLKGRSTYICRDCPDYNNGGEK